LKPERWRLLFLQENYQEEKACDKRNNNNNNNNIIINTCSRIITKYHATEILYTETDCKCRLCEEFDETVEHIISASPILTKEQYIKRRDRVCVQIYFNIRKEIGVKLDNKYWYNHVSKSKVMKLKLSYYGNNKRKTKEIFLTINRTS